MSPEIQKAIAQMEARKHLKPIASDYVDPTTARFNGPEYVAQRDNVRLTGQLARIHELMRDGRWRTLQEIADRTHDPAASVSAQLRHLRKVRFGAFIVERRARGDRARGLVQPVPVPAAVAGVGAGAVPGLRGGAGAGV